MKDKAHRERLAASVRELRSWVTDLERAIEPRQVGGQQVGARPGIRPSVRQVIRVAERIRDLIGWDRNREKWK